MRKFKIILFTLIMSSSIVLAQDKEETNLIDEAYKAKERLIQKDADIKTFFDNSEAYVIFPNVGKGGLFIGGAFGNGILYENNVAKGAVDLKRINVGLQAGGQAMIEVVFLENQDIVNEFKSGDFQFSANASATVINKGIAANLKYKNGVAVVVMPKAGLMAGVSVGGQKFSYDAFNNKM